MCERASGGRTLGSSPMEEGHLPLSPHSPTLYPTPMPTRTRPTTPRIHPTIRRSYEGRACPCEGRGTGERSPLLPPNPPPQPNVATLKRLAACGCRACPAKVSVLSEVLGLQGLPCLVSLCRFRAIFHRGHFGPCRPSPNSVLWAVWPALADTTCSPLSMTEAEFSDALQPGPSTPVQAVPGRYGSSPCHCPFPLTLPIPYPTPMPTRTRPPTPHLSHPRRSPSSQAEGAGPAPKEDHHKVQSHFNGPISRLVHRPQGVGAGPAPKEDHHKVQAQPPAGPKSPS